jgi:hypothetical protein
MDAAIRSEPFDLQASVRIPNRKIEHPADQNGVKRYLPHFLVSATYLLLGVRFFALISQYAVNILFWDQWDFDDATLFQHHSILEMFRWEHAPHRQGLGALLQKLIDPSIHWNGRDEAFIVGAIIFSAAVLALLLKVRLYGAVGYSDVIIPLLFLTPLQYETLVVTPNFAHGSLPSLLTVLYCFCWLIRPYHWKYVCVLLVNFLLIYTGFGIFMGVVTPALLALDYYAKTRHLAPKYQWGSALALTISIASLASFFASYQFQSAAQCFSFAPRNPAVYFWFAALMFVSAAGLKILSLTPATLIGAVVLLLLFVGLLVTLRRLLAKQSDIWSRDAAVAALLAYCTVFCLNTAYGRMCLGLATAGASRYTPYVVLGLFGLYLYALSIRRRDLRVLLVLALLVFAALGARPLNRKDAWIILNISNGKRVWRQCYLARHDTDECDALTNFKVHPRPDETHLQEKLDFLERNHLNLFDNSQ